MLSVGSNVRCALVGCAVGAVFLLGCSRGDGERGTGAGSGSSMPAVSAASSVQAALSAKPAESASAPKSGGDGAAPEGPGVNDFTALANDACQPKDTELGSYLQRGEISLGAREGGLSVSWLVQLPNRPDAQIAFGGYDGQSKQAARVRGIGTSQEHAPQVFATGTAWTVTWFDGDGLAFVKPPWEMTSKPLPVEHLRAVAKEIAGNVGLAVTPSGSLVAVAPFGAERSQLGVFLFAPSDPAEPAVRALGVSRHANKPVRPAVAADEKGYTVAYFDESGALYGTRFDEKGKEGDVAHLIAAAGAERKRLSLAAHPKGVLAIWEEGGDTIVARPLDAQAKPAGPPSVVAKSAKWFSAVPTKDGAMLCWVGQNPREGKLLAARVSGESAKPKEKGLDVLGDGRAVKDAPACGEIGGRAAFAWMEVMSPTVSTKRAMLRTIEGSCVP